MRALAVLAPADCWCRGRRKEDGVPFYIRPSASDPRRVYWVDTHGCTCPDHANRGETDAIETATRFCQEHGIQSTLVIPGDIPLTQSWELERIIAAAPSEGASLFPARFGNDSFKPHYAAAQATGKPCVVLSLPGIALDVDNPEDLRALAAAPGETRSQRLIRQWDLAELPLAANE